MGITLVHRTFFSTSVLVAVLMLLVMASLTPSWTETCSSYSSRYIWYSIVSFSSCLTIRISFYKSVYTIERSCRLFNMFEISVLFSSDILFDLRGESALRGDSIDKSKLTLLSLRLLRFRPLLSGDAMHSPVPLDSLSIFLRFLMYVFIKLRNLRTQ